MSSTQEKPTVLIVGAGLGGLMLGVLLERIGVPYTIFERTATIKTLGSAISVGSTLIGLFHQLGIFDDLMAVGKEFHKVASHNEDMVPYPPQDYTPIHELTGYKQYIVPRPALYDLLFKQLPANRVLFNKKIVRISEKDDKVVVEAADNTTYEGDLLVGADGAYSTVRQHLYDTLKMESKLPLSDQEELPFNCTCLVGQTETLNPEEYPQLKEPISQFLTVRGIQLPYSMALFTTAQNTICWMVIQHLNETTSKAAMEQNAAQKDDAGWGPQAVQSMCDETRSFRIPVRDAKGNYSTLGDMYDRTPMDLVSKVMLEEKVFKTWYSGRTVLLGDACHKINPAGGQGAATAMHDALALANLIYALPCKTTVEIEQLLTDYQAERYPKAAASFKSSRLLSQVLRKDLVGEFARFVSGNMPKWLWRKFLAVASQSRPLAGFLPGVESKGSSPAAISPSTEKARAVFESRQHGSLV
ncbi:hypothetical protein BGX33_004857 [Mortierella sp. NVP41]|nr:hypothetical protein BGX33_004857 [Mortierella sp. NVP41]